MGSTTLLKFPLPPDHTIPVALPPNEPFNRALSPAHILCSIRPASTTAPFWIVMVTLSLAALQGPSGSLVVKVNVTFPARISEALGM